MPPERQRWIALAWPLYRSPSNLLVSLWLEFRGQGLLGLQLLAPLIAASIVVFFARKTTLRFHGRTNCGS